MLVGKTAWYRPAPGFATWANASPAHRDTSWCATWPVIPSGPNVRTVSGVDLLHDRAHLLGAGRVQARLHVDVHRALEEVVLLHAEHVEAPEELGGPDLTHRVGRPALLVHRPTLTARGGDVHDPLARLDRGRHQAGGEVDVVVGMRPDTEDRPEIGHVDHADGC